MHKTVVVLEIETKMNKKRIPEVAKDDGLTDASITREEVEASIHFAIPRLLDSDRIKERIIEIIEEGGWIEDFDTYEFPKDYCDFNIKVLNNYQ